MPTLFYRLPQTIVKIFSGKNLWYHALAIILTFFIVTLGIDWQYYLATRNHILFLALIPAVVLGGLLPIIVPVIIVLIGAFKKDFQTRIIGWALGQAAILGLVISSFYKAFTGRIHPEFMSLADTSRQFQFGFLRGGVFWGWPSSHTTVAFAMSFALIMLFPRNKLISALALLYAFYVGFGISISIHWFSEFIAGALIGAVIGMIVGKSFRQIRT